MGTWNNKPFGNDTARDWAWSLKGDAGESIIQLTIDNACESKEPLDAPDAEQAIAAAAVIAGATTEPVRQLNKDIKAWIRTRGYVPSKASIRNAIKALHTVMKDSELRELWEESEALQGWLNSTRAVSDRLELALNNELPTRKPKKPAMPRLLSKLVERYQDDPDPAVRAKIRQKLENLDDVTKGSKETGYETPLNLMAQLGFIEEAQWLIDKGADIDQRSQLRGLKPISAACGSGKVEMVQFCVDAGTSLFEELLIDANTGMEMEFVEDKDAAQPELFRYMPALFSAALRGTGEMIEYLVSIGGDIRQLELNGETLLHRACSAGNLDVMRYLIGRGFDINDNISYHDTPLGAAARYGRVDAVKLLLDAGADVNLVDEWDGTAMDYGSANKEVVEILKAHGGVTAAELERG